MREWDAEDEVVTINNLERTLTAPAARQVLSLVSAEVTKAQAQGLKPKVVCFDSVAWRDLTSGRSVGALQYVRVYDLPVRLFDHLPGFPSGVKLLAR